jgi:hypothetical protein
MGMANYYRQKLGAPPKKQREIVDDEIMGDGAVMVTKEPEPLEPVETETKINEPEPDAIIPEEQEIIPEEIPSEEIPEEQEIKKGE